MGPFDRLQLLVGDQFAKLEQASVLVLGLGGVGSYAVEALVRSGIGKLILVDYDTIDITNLNRQLMTSMDNLGKLKSEVLAKRIVTINPQCQVVCLSQKITEENLDILFLEQPDYIIDACDTISVKFALIQASLERKIPLISSMGTGNKMDPSLLEITDIRATNYDPVAKILRKKIKDAYIYDKVWVVSSKEIPKVKQNNPVSSNAFVPATAGLLLASYVVRKIVGDL